MNRLPYTAFLDPKLIALAVAFAAIGSLIAASNWLFAQSARDQLSWQPSEARIVRFGATGGKYGIGRVVVVAQTPDGLWDQASVPLAKVEGCAVGDTIPAISNGSSLKLKPRPCQR
jgi:hypothetical protein